MASAWGLGALNGLKAVGGFVAVAAITGWAGFLSTSAGGSGTESAVGSSSQQVAVHAQDYAFTPPTITVKANQEVQVTLSNGATQAHNFTVQGLDQVYT